MMQKKRALVGYGLISSILILFLSYENRTLKKQMHLLTSSPVEISVTTSGFPATGPADAPITIIEFTDFDCVHCRHASNRMKVLQDAFPGMINRVFKNVPPSSEIPELLQIAYGAHLQGEFWTVYEQLFAIEDIGRAEIQQIFEDIALDQDKLKDDIQTGRCDQLINRANLETASLGITGVPTYLINGVRVSGFDEDLMRKLITRYLAEGR